MTPVTTPTAWNGGRPTQRTAPNRSGPPLSVALARLAPADRAALVAAWTDARSDILAAKHPTPKALARAAALSARLKIAERIE